MYQLIVLAILIGLFYAMYGLKPNIKDLIAQKSKKALLILGILLLAVLILTGKLNIIISLIVGSILALMRLAPLLPRFAPLLQRIFPGLRQYSQQRTGQQDKTSKRSPAKMDKDEAYEVLGLKPGASNEKIIETHRRLMQKLHPDRGGSDYLATKLNQARDVLLRR